MHYSVPLLFVVLGLGSNSSPRLDPPATRIIMDGAFYDWASVDPLYHDPSDDAPVGALDMGRLWVTNDERFIFFRFELNQDILIQEFNQLVLHLDTDNDPSTGTPFHGIGAELAWTFGSRAGQMSLGAGAEDIGQGPVGIVTSPTVSSRMFEVAFARDALPDGQHQLFGNPTIRIVLEDAAGADVLPDAAGGVAFTFDDETALAPLSGIGIGRHDAGDVRVLSYNVERDALFDSGRRPAFERILKALQPDIIGFQEILNHSAEETRTLVAALMPSFEWHASRVDPDIIVVSKYPILQRFAIEGGNQGDANGAFLLDMNERWGTQALVVNAHPPCCRADEPRQRDFDAMMAFLREAQSEGGVLDLEPKTPVIVLGDMNMVGFAEQLETLLTGDIINEDVYGADFDPDWNGTPLTDLIPRHVALPMTYTWFRFGSSFHPGRLDFIVFTDSVLEPANRFVLFTPAMHSDTLAQYGLEADDATVASDHLPVVGDFRYNAGTGTGAESRDRLREFGYALDQNFPNPFSSSTTIRFSIGHRQHALVEIYDLVGRHVARLFEKNLEAGEQQVVWDRRDSSGHRLPPGAYIYKLTTEAGSTARVLIAR